MKIVEYKIIRDEKRHPKLMTWRKYDWNGNDFNSYENIVDMMNSCFKLNKMNEEYAYIIAFDVSLNLLGIFELGHGSTVNVQINNKEIYTFLLLVGAEQFVIVHNHPSGTLEISNDDNVFTKSVNAFSGIINIEMTESIIIAGDGYCLIKEKQLEDFRRIFKKGG